MFGLDDLTAIKISTKIQESQTKKGEETPIFLKHQKSNNALPKSAKNEKEDIVFDITETSGHTQNRKRSMKNKKLKKRVSYD